MYSKVFQQIFDSSISEDHVVRHVFMDLLVLADRHGDVDMTLSAIARRTNVPISIVTHAISKLCEPDPDSRTKDEEGRRLVLMDDHREWGWRIVNFSHYNAMRNEDARREYFREYKRKQRANAHSHLDENVQDSPQLSTTVNRESTVSTYASAPTDAPTTNTKTTSPTSPKISQIGKKPRGTPLPPKGGGKKVKRETKKPKAKASGMESAGIEVLASHGTGTPELLAVDGTGEDSSGGADNQETQEASRGGPLDETTEDTRPDTADAAGRIAQVLALVPGISLGFSKSDGGGTGDDLPNAYEGLPEEVDPPALTPQTLEGVSQRERWTQLKVWLKEDLYMAGGAPINIQEVRFGTLSPGESDYDYCFRDSFYESHELDGDTLVWNIGSSNPPATTQGLKKYSTRIRGLLKQIVPNMNVQLKVQPAEYERRLG